MIFVRKPSRIYTIMDFKDGEEIEFSHFPESPSSKANGLAFYRNKQGYERLLSPDEVKESEDTDAKRCGKWLVGYDGYYLYCSECKNEPEGNIRTDFCPC